MQCPVCADQNLMMADRQGVEIDYCPKCRGIWLDRGELDKIIERSAAEAVPAPAPAQPQGRYQTQPERYEKDHYYKHSDGYGSPKKKKSILSEIFDF